MNNIKALLLAITLLLQGFSVLLANAQEKSVALVARLSGQVTLSRDKQHTKLTRSDELYVGDQIITGDESWLTINFYDLTRVVLRPNTQFVIHRFPQTMGDSAVLLQLHSGGVRVTAGTNSNGAAERFRLMTPEGQIQSSRSEWVVRICEGDECEKLEKSFSRCHDYANPGLTNKQFVSVYKGSVQLQYCRADTVLHEGSTASSEIANNHCETVEYVPCLILSDGNLGKDKLRALLPDLTKLPSTKRDDINRPARPQSRPRPPRPRTTRPRPRP